MFKQLMITGLLALSANTFANEASLDTYNDTPVYYMVYNYEDCVMVDESIVNQKGWFNVDNMSAKLIYPAIMRTNSPAEKADMTTHELHKIAGEYYANINSKEDLQLAESCGSLTPEEIN